MNRTVKGCTTLGFCIVVCMHPAIFWFSNAVSAHLHPFNAQIYLYPKPRFVFTFINSLHLGYLITWFLLSHRYNVHAPRFYSFSYETEFIRRYRNAS